MTEQRQKSGDFCALMVDFAGPVTYVVGNCTQETYVHTWHTVTLVWSPCNEVTYVFHPNFEIFKTQFNLFNAITYSILAYVDHKVWSIKDELKSLKNNFGFAWVVSSDNNHHYKANFYTVQACMLCTFLYT